MDGAGWAASAGTHHHGASPTNLTSHPAKKSLLNPYNHPLASAVERKLGNSGCKPMHILALKPECKILKGEKKLEVQKIVIYNTLWSLSFYILS